ncbi:MAG: hypothetical protein KQH67_07085 [Bacteroidetes bacterium]|nr:hypothetical protein [Bacteroidota bacterium]
MKHFLSKKDFKELAEVHDQHCISIYIPTARAGEDADKNHGRLRLKNSIKKVQKILTDYGLTEREIDNYLSSVKNLVDDHNFWRDQSDCLVIFLRNQMMKYYKIPIDFEEFTYVSDHFYLKPLISLFNGDGKFFLLNISLKGVKFYEGTRHTITRVFIDDLVPEKLEEVVGYDYQNKTLQFRSGQGGEAGAMFHGQGSGKDDKNVELEKFLRAVDKGLMKLIQDDDAPLILACVDHYLPVYAHITSYSNLFNKNISGNHEHTSPIELHELAWVLVEETFQQKRKKIINSMRDLSASGKTSYEINEIISASIDGRIEALFIQQLKDRYGLYDSINRSLIIDESLKTGHASLFNLAAVQTWLNNGQVFLVGPDEMPFEGTIINALFRY